LKRLALLWLTCAAIGFAVAASAAAVIALAFDRTPTPRAQAMAAPTTRQSTANDRRDPSAPGYSGQRLLGN
jgi:hypothetical protein